MYGSQNPGVCEGGGGTLIFSYIRRLGRFFGVQNFKFEYFLSFLEKVILFEGYEDFLDIFWGVITKLDYI